MKTIKGILVLIIITIMLIAIYGCEKPDNSNPASSTDGKIYPKTDPNSVMDNL